MLENELIKIVNSIKKQKCENNYIELKSAKEGCPKLYDTFSSFSNQQGGGIILFGIDQGDNCNICGVYDADDLQKKIMEQSLQMEPPIRPLCTTALIKDRVVVSAEIQEIDNFQKPCFYKGAGRLKGSYIRVADGDRLMTEYEVYSYEAFKKKIHDELREVDRANMEDIFTGAFGSYLINMKAKKPNLSKLSNERICELQGFATNNKPTLAGTVLFSEYPQAYFPQLCVTAVVVPGTQISSIGSVGERFIDNVRIDGTITQILNEALNFVRRNMKNKTIIDAETGKRRDKSEYPVIAIREIILNALIHRDYSIHTDSTPITIIMYKDRIEIENPGGLYGRMTLDQLGKVSADTRNPFIANAMEIMDETENRYSGIPTIINAMKEAGLPKPVFENNRGVFKVILYNNQLNKENTIENEILEFCKIPRSREEIGEFFKGRLTVSYIMSRYIRPMAETGVIGMTIPNKPKSKKQKYFTVEV